MTARRTSPGGGSHGNPLPPGQYPARGWPVLHYGPVPKFNPDSWDFRVVGATDSGNEHRWTYLDLLRLPRLSARANLHCVTKFTVRDGAWSGIPTSAILAAAPPAPGVRHVMVWAEYGYSANLRLTDFAVPDAIFALRCNGELLKPEHGFPVRLIVPHLYAWKGPKWVRAVEYLTEDRRGFWEERGYHNIGEVWAEQRYSYEEDSGDGPPP